MQIKQIVLTIIALGIYLTAQGQKDSLLIAGRDTICYKYTPIELPTDLIKNKEQQKNFKFSFLIAPAYTPSTSLLFGAMASGVYRIDKQNMDLSPSTVSLFASISITGMYKVGIDGVNIFKDDRNRLLYNLSFSSQPTYFWGIGYDAATTNERIEYTANKYRAAVSYYHRIVKGLYVGTRVNFDYIYCSKTPSEQMLEYLDGRGLGYSATGISLMLEYDSRDFMHNPHKGIFASLQAMIRPNALGSIDNTLWRINLNAAYYQPLWSGAVLALDLYGEFNSKDTPWVFYAQMGDRNRMRGYYEGQFMDRNLITAQAELRQKVWRMLGVAVWGGAGNCFHSFDSFLWSQTMPNYGVGLRWEINDRINFRFDYGFGGKVKGKIINGFVISLNEAF